MVDQEDAVQRVDTPKMGQQLQAFCGACEIRAIRGRPGRFGGFLGGETPAD
jgi:hypothetical protein